MNLPEGPDGIGIVIISRIYRSGFVFHLVYIEALCVFPLVYIVALFVAVHAVLMLSCSKWLSESFLDTKDAMGGILRTFFRCSGLSMAQADGSWMTQAIVISFLFSIGIYIVHIVLYIILLYSTLIF